MQPTIKGTLSTKPHFDILDGLRGVAALAVVGFHFLEMVNHDDRKNLIGHGFLAVDFFFCLSGFVIAYAYDNRMVKIGKKPFFISRLIRLHPLVILGTVLGLLGFLFDPFGSHSTMYGAGKVLLMFLTSIFLIPFPAMPERYFDLFGFNPPSWSLFWEYIANILYALVLYKISIKYLRILIIPAAVAICCVCCRAGTLKGGWGGPNFWDGSIRIAYSFLAGLFLYRSNWIIKTQIGFIGLCFLLGLSFIIPYSSLNWLLEPVIVLFYFPLLIAMGAGAKLAPNFKKICAFSGKISYPLYMTHYTAVWIFSSYFSTHKMRFIYLCLIIALCMFLLVAMAYLLNIVYDIPVRDYLTRKRKNSLADSRH